MKWETFYDHAYFRMHALRPEGDTAANSPNLFHLIHKEDAERLCEYLNKLEEEKKVYEGLWHSESCVNIECRICNWEGLDEE